MNIADYHMTCSMPAPSEWPTMLRQAESRFNEILSSTQQESIRNGGSKRNLLAARLRTRFNEGQFLFRIAQHKSFLLSVLTVVIHLRIYLFLLVRTFLKPLKVIDFILSERRIDVCNPNLEVRCYDLNAVFGDLEVNSVERLIQHSTQIVEQLELECPRVLFATYYMTLDGKASKLL